MTNNIAPVVDVRLRNLEDVEMFSAVDCSLAQEKESEENETEKPVP
jgi:hypothetical protein